MLTLYGKELLSRLKLIWLEVLLWFVHWLPLRFQAALGWTLGRILWHFDRRSQKIIRINLKVCFPDWPLQKRESVARDNYCWFTRSQLERGLLRFCSRKQMARHVTVVGDLGLADREKRPVMWLIPHFVAFDHIALVPQVFKDRPVVALYQPQPDQAVDLFLKKIRQMNLTNDLIPRDRAAVRLVRMIRAGYGFLNFPDMDWGHKDSAFIDFFGEPACTLLSPSRMARMLGMCVQPVFPEILPGGAGYRIRFFDPLPNFPSDDPIADMTLFNRWLECRIRENPAQYMWCLERFRTRPEGRVAIYA